MPISYSTEGYQARPSFANLGALRGLSPIDVTRGAGLSFKPLQAIQVQSAQPELVTGGIASAISNIAQGVTGGITAKYKEAQDIDKEKRATEGRITLEKEKAKTADALRKQKIEDQKELIRYKEGFKPSKKDTFEQLPIYGGGTISVPSSKESEKTETQTSEAEPVDNEPLPVESEQETGGPSLTKVDAEGNVDSEIGSIIPKDVEKVNDRIAKVLPKPVLDKDKAKQYEGAVASQAQELISQSQTNPQILSASAGQPVLQVPELQKPLMSLQTPQHLPSIDYSTGEQEKKLAGLQSELAAIKPISEQPQAIVAPEAKAPEVAPATQAPAPPVQPATEAPVFKLQQKTAFTNPDEARKIQSVREQGFDYPTSEEIVRDGVRYTVLTPGKKLTVAQEAALVQKELAEEKLKKDTEIKSYSAKNRAEYQNVRNIRQAVADFMKEPSVKIIEDNKQGLSRFASKVPELYNEYEDLMNKSDIAEKKGDREKAAYYRRTAVPLINSMFDEVIRLESGKSVTEGQTKLFRDATDLYQKFQKEQEALFIGGKLEPRENIEGLVRTTIMSGNQAAQKANNYMQMLREMNPKAPESGKAQYYPTDVAFAKDIPAIAKNLVEQIKDSEQQLAEIRGKESKDEYDIVNENALQQQIKMLNFRKKTIEQRARQVMKMKEKGQRIPAIIGFSEWYDRQTGVTPLLQYIMPKIEEFESVTKE